MSTHYRDASGRHLHDGKLLLDKERWANADHLFGLSAECSLKAVMEALGMKMKLDGTAPLDRGHKVHMPELWAAFQSFAQGQLEARYVSPAAATPDPDAFTFSTTDEVGNHHPRPVYWLRALMAFDPLADWPEVDIGAAYGKLLRWFDQVLLEEGGGTP